jgi:2-iminobutanoate/2-iminopropanoate deaminase
VSKPVAHYSASARAGDLLFVSGQLGLSDGALVEGVEAQTRQALVNFEGVLADNGATLTDVAKCTVFMTDIENFAAVNEVYASVFGDHRPARSAISVKALPLGGLVEIEGFAHLGDS